MSSTGAGYDQQCNTYSPDGKLYQVEYALKAVDKANTAVGVRCADGVVLAVEKVIESKLLVDRSNKQVFGVDERIGAVVVGHDADGRMLVNRAREEAAAYRSSYAEEASPKVLASRMGAYLHAYTCYWYLRPFGASMLLAGYDSLNKSHELYMCDPSGSCYRYFGAAIGKGARNAKTEIETRDFAHMTCEAALPEIAKILRITHNEVQEKDYTLEMGWVTAATEWEFQPVPADLVTAADAKAKASLESDDDDDDDDDVDMEK